MKRCIRCKLEKEGSSFSKNYTICKKCDRHPSYTFERDHKICSACGKDKKIAEFHKRTASPDGYNSRCKDCKKKDNKNHKTYQGNVPTKQCTKCLKVKDAEHFYKDRTKREGLTCWCKDCRNAPKVAKGQRVVTKKCGRCKIESSDFNLNIYRYDGLDDYCKPCCKIKKLKSKEKRVLEFSKLCTPCPKGDWLYIVNDGVLNKVGITEDPKERLRTLNKSFGPCHFVALLRSGLDSRAHERDFHRKNILLSKPKTYKNGDLSYEWYSFSVEEILKKLGSIEEIYYF